MATRQTGQSIVLDSEEYIEQAHLFRTLGERIAASEPVQEILHQVKQEILATTKLPMAIDFLLAEIHHAGTMASAMRLMPHYFAAFQTFLVATAEAESGRFDMPRALLIMQHEARFRASNAPPAGLFFFQFETLCRNRLSYDFGLEAMSRDFMYDSTWQAWIRNVRHKIGLIDIADLVYVHSQYYIIRERQSGRSEAEIPEPLLFGEKEGRIALANRRKEPLFFFAALQRQLHYPAIPRPTPQVDPEEMLRKLSRQIERLETRIKLLEDEQREKGIDLSKFYGPTAEPPSFPET